MPVPGAIAERTQGILPVTWTALESDDRYGDSFLQGIINLVKENVFGTIVAPAAEADYPLIVIDYAAKLAAIELAVAGIDFWMSQEISLVASQPNEVTTYTDRAHQLQELRKELIAETRAKAGEIADLIGFRRTTSRVPLSSTLRDEFLTPSPQEFPRPYILTDRS